jgi:hypothetical protein
VIVPGTTRQHSSSSYWTWKKANSVLKIVGSSNFGLVTRDADHHYPVGSGKICRPPVVVLPYQELLWKIFYMSATSELMYLYDDFASPFGPCSTDLYLTFWFCNQRSDICKNSQTEASSSQVKIEHSLIRFHCVTLPNLPILWLVTNTQLLVVNVALLQLKKLLKICRLTVCELQGIRN